MAKAPVESPADLESTQAEASTEAQTKAGGSEKTIQKGLKSEAEPIPNPNQQSITATPHTFYASPRLETEANVDICIVHCFTGDNDLEAFTPKEPASRPQRGPWLKDSSMLESFAPEGRVLVLGFDLRTPTLEAELDFLSMGRRLLTFLLLFRSAEQRKNRPLILIGHGLGGTVVQTAVSRSKDSEDLKGQLDRVIGIIFIATPFDGSTSLITYLDRLLKLPSTSAKLDGLEDKSTHLKRIFQSFVLAVAPETVRYRRVHLIERSSRRWWRHHNREAAALKLSESLANPESGLSETPLSILLAFEDNLRFDDADDYVFGQICRIIAEFVHTHFLLAYASLGLDGFDKLKELITKSVNVNLKDRWGTTALHEAVKARRFESVQLLLLRGGASVNTADNTGTTPLHLAVVEQDRNIIDLLLRNGADVNALDSLKKSPLEMSRSAEYAGPQNSIKELLQYRPLVEGPSALMSSGNKAFKIRVPVGADIIDACKDTPTVAGEVYFFNDREQYLPVRSTVWDLLYDMRTGRGPRNIIDEHRPSHLEAPICRWYHMPANNMAWIEDMFKRLQVSTTIWGTQHGRQYRGPPHSRSIVSECVNLNSQDRSKEILALFVPFVSYERNTRLDCFRDLQRGGQKGQAWRERWLNRQRTNPHDEDATSMVGSEFPDRNSSHTSTSSSNASTSGSSKDSEDDDAKAFGNDQPDESETAILQYYLNHEPPLHTRRTLDQAHYYMLKDTRDRDVDQVATRWADKHHHSKLHNVLMVDQLWLWIIRDKSGLDPDVVVSSFPNRKGFESGDEDDVMLNVLSRQRKQRHPIRTSLDLVSQIMATCCNIFDRRQDREMLQFLNFYESAIGSAVNKEAKLFDRFAKQARKLEGLNAKHRGYHQIKILLLNELFRISDEVKLLREVKDIKDEIEIISSILTAQRKVVQSLSSESFRNWRLYSIAADDEATETLSYQHVEQMIDTAILDFSTMTRHVESAEASLNHLLDLKNKEANLHEAHTSNERAEEAVRQGQTVLIFTMVTIVFLPLSFMSSFFAISVTAFPHDSGGNLAWPLHEVSGYIFGMTFALALPLLIGTFAISSGRLKTFYHSRILPGTARLLVRVLEIWWMAIAMTILGLGDKRRRWINDLDRINKELNRLYPKPKDAGQEMVVRDVRRGRKLHVSTDYYESASSYYYSYSASSSDETEPIRQGRVSFATIRRARSRRRAIDGWREPRRTVTHSVSSSVSHRPPARKAIVGPLLDSFLAFLNLKRRDTRRIEVTEVEEYA